MKKTIIILVFSAQILLASDITTSLVSFASRVSLQNNINILIDEEIDINISLLVPDNIPNRDLFFIFKNTIKKHNFNLRKYGKTYYLTKSVKYKKKSHLYMLKYDSYKDCQAILSSMSVPFKYLDDLNAFMIKATDADYVQIDSFLKKVDIKSSQVMLKIMIFEFDDDETKERGVQYGSIYKGIDSTIKTALNTIILPISTNNPILQSANFYGAVRLLNQDKAIRIKQNPFILVKNNKSFKFEAVQNIPYLVSNTTTQATNTSEQNTIEYKDVGLKINGKSFIHENYITLDLDLIIEDLITDTATNTPQTYKRVLKSNTNIKYNEVLLLSGLKRTKIENNDFSIPFISNIPYLGEIFKYSYDTKAKINITIAIEVIKSITED